MISRSVQKTFFHEYLQSSGLSYSRLLHASKGWEFNWLGEWALARRCHDLRPVPPRFLHFRTDEGIREARAAGVTRESIARHYSGVALAARHQETLEY